MIPLVLGGIALAAVGYGLKELCEEEGCPWDDKPVRTAYKDEWATYKSTKESFNDEVISVLGDTLLRVEGSPYSIDKDVVFKKESYEEDKFTSMPALHMSGHILEKYKKESYISACSDILDEAYEIGEFYVRSMAMLLEQNCDASSFSKVEKKMFKQAFKFYTASQALLGQKLLNKKGVFSKSIFKAFEAYEEVVEKHKVKVPNFIASK